jgi:hypothetical protein
LALDGGPHLIDMAAEARILIFDGGAIERVNEKGPDGSVRHFSEQDRAEKE